MFGVLNCEPVGPQYWFCVGGHDGVVGHVEVFMPGTFVGIGQGVPQ